MFLGLVGMLVTSIFTTGESLNPGLLDPPAYIYILDCPINADNAE